MLWSAWWGWAAGALVLGILELAVPGYIFLGFAAGALALSALFGLGGPLAVWLSGSLPLTLVTFAVLSLVAWFVMRRVFGLKSGGEVKTFDHDIND